MEDSTYSNTSTSTSIEDLDRDYDDERSYYSDEYLSLISRLFLELFTIVALLAVISNIILIFAILKYKKLRREPTNQLIAHLSILQAAYLFLTPFTHRLFFEFSYFFTRNSAVYFCVFTEFEHSIYLGVILIFNLLLADWYIKVYKDHLYARFTKVYKFALGFMYILVISLLILSTKFSCFNDWYFSPFLILSNIAGFLIVVIVLIVMNIIHRVKSRRLTNIGNVNNTGLVLTNIFVLFWLPAACSLIAVIAGHHVLKVAIPIIVLGCIGFTSSLANFAYLFYYDNSFNLILKKVVLCKCRRYENEELEDDETTNTVTYDCSNGVQIYDNNLSTTTETNNIKNSRNNNRLIV